MGNILRYEWRLFLRNRVMISLWLVVLLMGFYALYCGHSFQKTQTATINTLDTAYQNRVTRQVDNFSADTSTKDGKIAYTSAHDPFINEYRVKPVVWKKPAALQALSIGQGDNQPFYNDVEMYFANVYTSKQVEIRNPDKLLAGNFDLTFVFIYLLPIVIIAFCYAVISGDRELGITNLLLAQGVTLPQLLTSRLLFRFLLIAALILILNSIGFIVNSGISLMHILYWSSISLLYALFWFSLVYAVVSINLTSVITALVLVGMWVFVLLLIPSVINNFTKVQDAERVELSDAERDYSIHIWELWQAKTMKLPDTLFSVKPEWKKYGIKDIEDVRSAAYSYLTLLYMNSKGRVIDSLALTDQQRLNRYNYINPAYAAQQAFNQLAGSEASSFISYRSTVADYQQKRNETVNEYRLSGKPLSKENFDNYPVFRQPDTNITSKQWLLQLLPLVILCIVCIAFGEVQHRVIKSKY